MAAKKAPTKVRGVYEREQGSGIWWIRYEVEGKPKREKVGRRSDAIALYQKRKADVHIGIKLPTICARGQSVSGNSGARQSSGTRITPSGTSTHLRFVAEIARLYTSSVIRELPLIRMTR
jgi:hypothetical protein